MKVQSKQVFNQVPEALQIINEPLYVFSKFGDRTDRDLHVRDLIEKDIADQGLQVKYPVCFECFDKILSDIDEKTKEKEAQAQLYA